MRDALAPLAGQRITVTATLLRHSMRMGWAGVREPTVLLGQVLLLDGTPLTDHVWLTVGKRLAAADLHLGDVVQLSARVAVYRRGFRREPDGSVRFSEDFGLGYASSVVVVSRALRPVQQLATPSVQPTMAQQVVAAIADLWQEQGEPPSVPRLVEQSHLSPMAVISHLRRLAKAGIVVFQPDGSVFLRPTSTTGALQ